MADFRAVDAIWAERLGHKTPFPVSTFVGVSSLAKKGAKVEIEVAAEA